MKRFFVVFLVVGLITTIFNEQQIFAQEETVNDGVYVKENIPGKKPIPYRQLREADIMWSKKIWQVIDCREKMNHPLYFPLEGEVDDRRSLMNLFMYGIRNEGLIVYKDDQFQEIMTLDEVLEKLDALPKTQQVTNPETGELEERVIEGRINYDEISQYEIKEQWYFDKQHSTMRVRILGICPIRRYVDPETEQARKERTFWVYFPAARHLMANQEVFNRHNDAQRISFDDLFFQRRFNSYIIAESNVYDNRPISTYMQGVNNLLEAEKIKQELFEIEHDLWEY
ncbi:MAG: gliding motility protein GldN [Bacteroidales bacterium]|jgi:gliding motility associated protien GldN|nr:gliding motility protein GldN [Bacteroidales bacterium]